MKCHIVWLVLLTIILATPGSPLATAAEPDGPNKKLKVVVFGGHPDDPESGAGGLIATLTRAGTWGYLRLRNMLPG